MKYHNLISFVIGLLFVIVLQIFATPEPVFRFLVPGFLALLALVYAYNRWYLKQILKYNIWLLVRPLMLLGAGFGLYLTIPSESLRSLFLILCLLVIFSFEMALGNFSESVLLNETLLIAFGMFICLSAFYQYVPRYSTLYLALVFASSALLARSFYEFIPKPVAVKIIGSLVIGLFVSELFWSLGFLPLHFSILGLTVFNFFYLFLILNYYHIFQTLNFKKVQYHLFLIAACTVLVLAATPWKILI